MYYRENQSNKVSLELKGLVSNCAFPRSKFDVRGKRGAKETVGAVRTLQLGEAIPLSTYGQIAGNSLYTRPQKPNARTQHHKTTTKCNDLASSN